MTDYQHLLRPRTAKVVQEASFLRRAFAFIFDVLLLDLIVVAPFAPLFDDMLTRMEGAGWTGIQYTNQELGAAIILFVIVYLYFVLMEYVLGQTVGQMLLDIRVEGNDRLSPILVRNSFILPVFPFIAFWVIEPIAIGVWRRSVLEHLSNTRTLYRRTIFL